MQILNDGRLLVADFRQAAIYSQDGKVEWRHEQNVASAIQLPSGNILLSHMGGLSVIDLDGEKLWEMKHAENPGSYFYAKLE